MPGFEGLVFLLFELKSSVFVSGNGGVFAQLTATYKLLLSPRPSVALCLNSSQNVPEFGVWRGFNNVKQGLYLRYGIRREFASYIGINWIHQPGDTADLTRAADDPSEDLPSVFGLRLGW